MIDAALLYQFVSGRERQELDDVMRDDGYVRELEREHDQLSIWNSPPPSIRRVRRRGGAR